MIPGAGETLQQSLLQRITHCNQILSPLPGDVARAWACALLCT